MEYKKYNQKKFKSRRNEKQIYKIINENTYTEDGILIYNLQGSTITPKVVLEDILKYFQGFDKNVKVSLMKNHKYLIEFADYKQAANVLDKSNFILNYKLYVEPCPSWFQPEIKNLVKYVEQKYNPKELQESEVKPSLILKLNDDCLMEICKKLTIPDQINFALCSQRFCEIFQAISRIKYTNLNMNDLTKLSYFQIKIFGFIIGPFIKVLTFNITKFAKLFCTYCKNVETLKIDCEVLEIDLLKFLNEQMPNVKKLELQFMESSEDLNSYLKIFKNLKSLHISSYTVSGAYISSLANLTELSVYNCIYFYPEYFKRICEKLKKLQYLDIRKCWRLSSENFEQILENLRELETLKFSNTKENFVCISRLPKLKYLEIHEHIEYKEFSNDFLTELVKHQATQLLEFKIYYINLNLQQISIISQLKSLKVLHCTHNDMLNDKCLQKLSTLTKLQEINLNNCKQISNEGILRLLEHCLELKKLNLEGCELLPSDFVIKALELLQNHHVKSFHAIPVHIVVEDTELFRITVDELGLQFAKDKLKITFKKTEKENVAHKFIRKPRPTDGWFICRAPPVMPREIRELSELEMPKMW